ncbi:MAG: hypothetical protein ACPG7F_00445 [Aggregatilineales bacterium]
MKTDFERFDNIQQLADELKSAVDAMQRLSKESRRALLTAIRHLECHTWHPVVMQEEYDKLRRPHLFHIDGIVVFGGTEEVVHQFCQMIMGYTQRPEIEANDMHPARHLLAIQEAADYVGLSIDGFRKHVSRIRTIRGQQLGKLRVFTRAELDTWQIVKPERGKYPRN